MALYLGNIKISGTGGGGGAMTQGQFNALSAQIAEMVPAGGICLDETKQVLSGDLLHIEPAETSSEYEIPYDCIIHDISCVGNTPINVYIDGISSAVAYLSPSSPGLSSLISQRRGGGESFLAQHPELVLKKGQKLRAEKAQSTAYSAQTVCVFYPVKARTGGGGGGGTGSAAYEKKTVYPYADSSNQYAASDILASVFPIHFSIGESQWVINNGSSVNLESVHRNEDGRDVIELMAHGITIPGAPGAVDLTMGLCQIGLDGYYIGPANSDYYIDGVIDEGDLSVGQSNTLPAQGVTKFFNLSAAFKLSDRAMNFLAAPEHSTYTLDQLDQVIVVPPESSSAPGKAREFTLVFDNEYCSSTPNLVLSADGDGFYNTGEEGPELKRGCVTVMNFNEVASSRGVNYFTLNQQFLHNVDIPKLDAYWGLTFTAIDAGAIVEMEKTGSSGSAPAVSLEYSLDNGNTWSPFIIGETTIVLANAGDTACFQAGDGGTGGDGVNLAMGSIYDNGTVKGVNKFKIVSGRIAASGNISSILNRNGTVDQLISGAFSELFKDCISLVRAPKLPAVSMGLGCYQSMFENCTSLTRAPELPATALAERCYSCMFRTCTSLVQAPKLSTTALADTCYQSMFNGCTSLTQAPELPAVILARCCYQYMFKNCTSLTQAPELPAVLLASGCYQYMFKNCTSLTQAPELSAPMLTDTCYINMFENCSNLFYIKVHFKTWRTASTTDWVSGVRSTGIFICKSDLPHTNSNYGSSYIPSDWTVVTF